jgi:acetyl esterase/lipase
VHFVLPFLIAFSCCLSAGAETNPPLTLPLWPETTATANQAAHETDTTTSGDQLVAGRRVERLTNVTAPNVEYYPAPADHNSGTAVLVFPGGGYRILALDLEGTEVCSWLNSSGISCLLLKYRVPDAGPYPKHSEDLADAQRAVRLTREHAAEWNLRADRIGVLGFSAGGHLAAVLSNHAAEPVYKTIDAADGLSAKPDFVVMIYPGGLVHPPNLGALGEEVTPTSDTPQTFLVQAEDDPVHVENTLVYYDALKHANVPAEMHVYAQGRHGYGLRETALPVTKWPALAITWFHTIGVLQ